jgi:hypothetical protein
VDLFRRPGFTFAASDSEPLLQVADMISGTVLRLHESEPQATIAEPLRALLRLRAAAFIEWPPTIRTVAAVVGASEHDAAVRAHCLSLVADFITEHAHGQGEDVAAQVATLRFLLFHFNAVSEGEFVSTDRLRAALEDVGLNPPSEQAMRARVIARLRDHGVIVASSSKGYKIPASVADLMSFVDRTDRTMPRCGGLLHIVLLSLNGIEVRGSARARSPVGGSPRRCIAPLNGARTPFPLKSFHRLRVLARRPAMSWKGNPGSGQPGVRHVSA